MSLILQSEPAARHHTLQRISPPTPTLDGVLARHHATRVVR